MDKAEPVMGYVKKVFLDSEFHNLVEKRSGKLQKKDLKHLNKK
jgi:hypothetical protein